MDAPESIRTVTLPNGTSNAQIAVFADSGADYERLRGDRPELSWFDTRTGERFRCVQLAPPDGVTMFTVHAPSARPVAA